MSPPTKRPSVWTAVADPSRRRLIELLRAGPRTSSDLARAFATTRFAVRKHLRVLEAVGLVRVRRQGRQRWNELDPAPLAELQGRWPDQSVAAGTSTDSAPPSPRTSASGSAGGLSTFEITLEVFLDVVPSRVFDALTFNVAAWWGPPFLRSADATGLVLEGRLGGHFVEEWGHRQGVIRGTVTAVRQDERLEISGPVGADALLPAVLDFTLLPREGGTLLRFTHRGVGAADPDPARLAEAYRAAWNELLAVRLKALLERGVSAGIGHAAPPRPERSAGPPSAPTRRLF